MEKIQNCIGYADTMVVDDSSCGFSRDRVPCGQDNNFCQNCMDWKDREAFGLKRNYCGIKEEQTQCHQNDQKHYQCYNCRLKDFEELKEKRSKQN